MRSLLKPFTTKPHGARRSNRARRGQSTVRCVGMDLDLDAVRVAAIGHRDGSGRLRWETYMTLPLEGVATQIDSPQALSEWIDAVIESLPRCPDGFRNSVAISLPPSWVHYEITRDSDSASARSVCEGMFQRSAFRSPAQTRVWPAAIHSDRQVLVACSKQATLEIVRRVHQLGYEIAGVFPPGVSLAYSAESLTGLRPQCVVSLRQHGGVVNVVSERATGLCRKLSPLPPSHAHPETLDALEPWLETVAQDIRATLAYAGRGDDPESAADPVLVAGPLAAVDGVDDALASRLQRPVAIWRYIGRERPLAAGDVNAVDVAAAVPLSLAFTAATLTQGSRR